MLWNLLFLCTLSYTAVFELNLVKFCSGKVDENYQCKRNEFRPIHEWRVSKLPIELKPIGKKKLCFKPAKPKLKSAARGRLIQFLEPKGFRVNWPNGMWMKSLEFNGNLNKPFTATVSRGEVWGLFKKISRAGILSYWVYENRNVSFKNGDIMYYWIGMDCEEGHFVSFPELDDVEWTRFYYIPGRKVIREYAELEFEELSYLRFINSNYTVWNESLRYNLSLQHYLLKPHKYDPRVSDLVNESLVNLLEEPFYESK